MLRKIPLEFDRSLTKSLLKDEYFIWPDGGDTITDGILSLIKTRYDEETRTIHFKNTDHNITAYISNGVKLYEEAREGYRVPVHRTVVIFHNGHIMEMHRKNLGQAYKFNGPSQGLDKIKSLYLDYVIRRSLYHT